MTHLSSSLIADIFHRALPIRKETDPLTVLRPSRPIKRDRITVLISAEQKIIGFMDFMYTVAKIRMV
jgi:hypothetical protein